MLSALITVDAIIVCYVPLHLCTHDPRNLYQLLKASQKFYVLTFHSIISKNNK